MAEPFKNSLNTALVRQMASELRRVWSAFPEQRFIEVASTGLDRLELKARALHIAEALAATLPEDFDKAASILEASLAPAPEGDAPMAPPPGTPGLYGWAVWPMTEFIAARGLPHFERALAALRELTQRASSEFAVRPFLAADPERALRVMSSWLQDPSRHVRRLISEGTRPRLPWGLRLQCFVENPRPCLPLLERLHADPNEYVRLSVSNHLNDISKDHPELAVEIATRWLADGRPETRKLVSHALRSLVKQGHPATLALLGFSGGKGLKLVSFSVSPKSIKLGGKLTLCCELKNGGKKPVNLALDYAVHHMKANGTLSPKVFKGTKRKLAPGESTEITLRHEIKEVTTRRYYPGKHKIELRANGHSQAEAEFVLKL